MSNLIVIRIVPQSPVDAGTFTNYLKYLGGLQITAYDLSFNSPTIGQSVGSAVYVAPTRLPSPLQPIPDQSPTQKPPRYARNTGIAQQVDHIPAQPEPNNPSVKDSAYYQFQAVANAVIAIPSPPPGQTTFENLRLVATWGSGATSQPIPISSDYYDVALAPGRVPNHIQWSTLPPSLYFSLPAPPTKARGFSFTLPSDGSPPTYHELLSTVQSVLNIDPGGAPPNLETLTETQCRNIAYEIIWSQQKPLPTPDRIKDLYTNPPNQGVLFCLGRPPI